MVHGVAECRLYQFRAFLIACRISYGVFVERIEHHYHRHAVAVDRATAAFPLGVLFIVEFHRPSVKRPEQHRGGGRKAFVLHSVSVHVVLCAESSGIDCPTVLLCPVPYRAPGDPRPSQSVAYRVVVVGNLLAVEIGVKAYEFCYQGHLFFCRHPCGILVAELAADQHLVIGLASPEIFIVFTLQHSRVFRQGVRVYVGHAGKMRRYRSPKVAHFYPAAPADLALFCLGFHKPRPASVKY